MVDGSVLVSKLEDIDRFTEELRDMSETSKDEYLSNVVVQRAVERTLMNVVQACIDIARHIRTTAELGTAETAAKEIRALSEADIISTRTGEKLEEAVGFRNLLAHRYGEIDHDLVYEVLQEDLEWFERYQREIADWYRERAFDEEP